MTKSKKKAELIPKKKDNHSLVNHIQNHASYRTLREHYSRKPIHPHFLKAVQSRYFRSDGSPLSELEAIEACKNPLIVSHIDAILHQFHNSKSEPLQP